MSKFSIGKSLIFSLSFFFFFSVTCNRYSATIYLSLSHSPIRTDIPAHMLIGPRGSWVYSLTSRHVTEIGSLFMDLGLGSVPSALVTTWMARWWISLFGRIYWISDLFPSPNSTSVRMSEIRRLSEYIMKLNNKLLSKKKIII